jgi:transposase
LLHAVFALAHQRGLIDLHPEGAVDSTGLETRRASFHYLSRKPGGVDFRARGYAKLTVVCHTASYLWAAGEVSRGPSNDAPQFLPAVFAATEVLALDRVLADGAYDSERHHSFCREVLGIRQTVIPVNQRGKRCWPKSKYRRQLRRRFLSRIYRNRVHVESSFSQDKRQLGSALRARTEPGRLHEARLRVLTHDLMILRQFRVSTELHQASGSRLQQE